MTFKSVSFDWLTVTSPSAHAAWRAAVSGVTAGPIRSGKVVGQRPQPAAVDLHQSIVIDLLPCQQPSNDVDAFDEALVPHVLARPRLAVHPLVGSLARSERRPEPSGKHLSEGCDGLGDDRRMVALTWRVDDAERQLRSGQRCPEERPGEARFALPLAPRAEVVRGHRCGEAGLLGPLNVQ